MSFSFYYPAYFPSLQTLADLTDSTLIVLTDQFQFTKRSGLVRTKLTPADNYLTIPVKHNGEILSIVEKKISSQSDWKKKHLNAIYHHYHKLPFFDYFYDDFKNIYFNEVIFLGEFLYKILRFYGNAFKIDAQIESFSKFFGTGLSIDDVLKNNNKLCNFHSYGRISKTNPLCKKLTLFDISYQEQCLLPKRYPFWLNPLEFLFTFGAEAAFLLRS